MKARPDREGFITNWLISGPKAESFVIDNPFDDQLQFEKYMRSVLRDDAAPVPPQAPLPGEQSGLGLPWRYSGGGSRYVDQSFFYHNPARVELYGYTELIVPEDCQAAAALFTYGALDLLLNGEPVCRVERPVYKPIIRKALSLNLKKGRNSLFVRLQNLGVRDTRNIFALCLPGAPDTLEITLPGPDGEGILALDAALRSVICDGDTLILPHETPGRIWAEPAGNTQGNRVKLPPGTRRALVIGEYGSCRLERIIEVLENITPSWADPAKSEEERRKDMIRRIGANKKPDNRFEILSILARYALGEQSGEDRAGILRSLEHIDECSDCSDFIAAGLIRLVKKYPLEEEILEKIRRSFLNYRFWMDEQGSDGMCFWSENHALLFHGAQTLAGAMYQQDLFPRSGRTGREQEELGARRCREWLEDVLAQGFEEFLSSGYMCVTIGALLNLADFAPEPLAGLAVKAADKLLEQLCRHAFKGTVIGPQGRVYRDVIFPFLQGTQSILHYLNPDTPCAENDWPVFFASSKYRPPEHLRKLMDAEISESYPCGNGEIVLHKQKSFILSSAASPRKDPGLSWRNISFDDKPDRGSYRYTKSLNERFHGTTDFRPGVFGYQQHFWYGALNAECIVFTNLPGGDRDSGTMRPGYWYGNGVFPAVKQERNVLGAIYHIPETYPIRFTHLFFPALKFDEYRQEGRWIFGRKDKAWLGIWCATPLEWHDDMLSRCELRAYADRTAYLCVCSGQEKEASFEAFTAACRGEEPCFDEGRMILSYTGGFSLRYAAHFDQSQYI
ncbi:MAG: hypothetical protein LBH26_03590 [Treponema sp.]|jgi:hypothetical protein|nr:hypothetical protein [Treponema sp.]